MRRFLKIGKKKERKKRAIRNDSKEINDEIPSVFLGVTLNKLKYKPEQIVLDWESLRPHMLSVGTVGVGRNIKTLPPFLMEQKTR